MAKSAKKKPAPNHPDHYEEKLVVNGTFMDIINASVKYTKANTPKKKVSK